MQIEHALVIWSYIRNKGEVLRESKGFKAQ